MEKRLGTTGRRASRKTQNPKRSSLKTRYRVFIVSRQRNDFNVKATNRPDDPWGNPGNRLEAARLATKRASAAFCAASGARTKDGNDSPNGTMPDGRRNAWPAVSGAS